MYARATWDGDLIQLDHEDVAAIAASVVALMSSREPPGSSSGLVTADDVARDLAVSRSWVYAHKRLLGAIPVGGGSRPRLRFDLRQARASFGRLASADTSDGEPTATRRATPPSPRVPDDIVLIRGRSGR